MILHGSDFTPRQPPQPINSVSSGDIELSTCSYISSSSSSTSSDSETYEKDCPIFDKLEALRPHQLANPDLYSSEAIVSKLNALEKTQFDAESAVKAKLESSIKCKNKLNSELSKPLNYALNEKRYTELVSLDESQEASQQFLGKRRSQKRPTKPIIDSDLPGPDISLFYSESFERQVPYIPSVSYSHFQPIKICSQNLEELQRKWRTNNFF